MSSPRAAVQSRVYFLISSIVLCPCSARRCVAASPSGPEMTAAREPVMNINRRETLSSRTRDVTEKTRRGATRCQWIPNIAGCKIPPARLVFSSPKQHCSAKPNILELMWDYQSERERSKVSSEWLSRNLHRNCTELLSWYEIERTTGTEWDTLCRLVMQILFLRWCHAWYSF